MPDMTCHYWNCDSQPFCGSKIHCIPGSHKRLSVDRILDHFVTDCTLHRGGSLLKFIQSCLLISTLWVTPCWQYPFHTITFSMAGMHHWLKGFPVPDRSPAHHIRDLCLSFTEQSTIPTEFLRQIQLFTKMRIMSLLGNDNHFSSTPSFAGLPVFDLLGH